MSKNNTNPGFGIVETIIALGIFLIIIMAGASGVLHSLTTQSRSEALGLATQYAQAGMEAVLSIRQQGWSSLVPGTYGLSDSLGSWAFSGTSDTYQDLSRSVIISEVMRDGTGVVVQSGGTVDPDILKARVEVTWTTRNGATQSVVEEKYFTRFDKTIPTASGGGTPARFCGTQTTLGTNLNTAAAAPLQWSYQSFNDSEYSYSSGSPTEITFDADGDYMLAVSLPFYRTDNNNTRTRIQAEAWLNGTMVTGARTQSSHIRNADGHEESSDSLTMLINGVKAGDKLTIRLRGVSSTDSPPVFMTTLGCIVLKKIAASSNVFSATATQAAGIDLNQDPSPVRWTEQRKDSIYTHSNSNNTHLITVGNTGNYFLAFNMPLTGSITRGNILCRVLKNGTPVSGASCAQGYIRNTNSDNYSSIHWFGVIQANAGDTLSVTVEMEAAGGEIFVDGNATLFIHELPTTGVIALEGSSLLSGANWNSNTGSNVSWTSQKVIDSQVFSHSTSTNRDRITVLESGDYLLSFSSILESGSGRPNVNTQVLVNGSPVAGATASTYYIRGSNGHDHSSGAYVFLLEDLQPNDTIRIRSLREADTDVLTAYEPAQLMIWKQ